MAKDGTSEINISDSAVLNLLGLTANRNNSSVLNLGVGADGGRINLGADGINTQQDYNLGNGTLGALASWSASANMSLVGTRGTIIDTEIQDPSTNSGTGNVATINLSGVLSGDGKLIKEGEGTLILSGENTFTGGISLNGGILELNHASAAGTGTLTVTGSSLISTNIEGGALTLGGLAFGGSAANPVILNMGGLGYGLQITTGSLSLSPGATLIMDVGAISDKIIYTGGALSGSLNFDLTLNGITETGSYTVLSSTSSLANLNINTWTPNYRGMEATFGKVNNDVVLNITNVGQAGNLSWSGSNTGIWEVLGNGNSWTGENNNQFFHGDHVNFDSNAANKNVQISGQVNPGSITVTGDGYVFSSVEGSNGAIIGTGSLTMNALNGTLTVNNANRFTGGTYLNAGTLVMGNSQALGSGDIVFGGGSLGFAANMGTVVINNQFVTSENNNEINLILNGNNVTLTPSISSGDVNVNVSGGGSFGFTGFMNVNQVHVGANTTVTNYGATNSGSHGHLMSLSGEGNFVAATTGSSGRIYTQASEGRGFTGTFSTTAASQRVTLATLNSTVDNRFSLHLAQASGHFYIVNETAAITTLYINNLNGTGNVEYTYSSNGGAQKRHLDMLLTEDCNYSGSFVYNAARMGNVIIGSDGNSMKKISMSSGMNGTGGTGENDGNLIINNAIVEFTDEGKWLGNIKFGTDNQGASLGGQLILAGGGMDRTTDDRFISGNGTIIVAAGDNDENIFGVANNDFTGDIQINSGKLSATVTGALGADNVQVTVNGGILNLGGVAHNQNLFITGGNLENASGLLGNVNINQSNSTASTINLGGLNADKITSFVGSVSGDTVTQLTGLTGTLTLTGSNNVFGVGSSMVGTNTSNSSIVSGADVVIADGSTVDLTFTSDAATKLIENLGNTGDRQYITITDGSLTVNGSFDFVSQYAVLGSLFDVVGAQDGSLVLAQNATDRIWVVASGQTMDINSVNHAGLSEMNHIINNGTIKLDIAGVDPGTLVLNGFCGTNSNAVLDTGANKTLIVEFAQGEAIQNGATDTYEGSISGSAQLNKTGDYILNINGSLTASALTVSQGSLILGGKSGQTNVIDGALTMANGTVLGLNGKNIVTQANSLVAATGSTIQLSNGARLQINSSVLLDASVEGNGTFMVNNGTFDFGQGSIGSQVALGLGSNASWTLSENATVGGIAGSGSIDLNGQTLNLDSAGAVFTGELLGSGTLVKNGDSSQVITGGGNANVNLSVEQGSLTLNNMGNIQSAYGDTNVAADSTLKIGNVAASKASRIAGATNVTNVKLSSLTMADGSNLHVTLAGNTQADTATAPITTENAAQLGNVNVTITCNNPSDFNNYNANGFTFTLINGESGEATLGKDHTLSMGFLNALFSWELVANGSNVDVVGKTRDGNYYATAGLTHNSMAVANLLHGATQSIINAPNSTLKALADAVANDIEFGNIASAARSMAAAGGSTITSLSMAQRDGLRDQMGLLRNRTVSMGLNQSVQNDDLPYYHFWVQGIGGYNDLKVSGDESGYKLSSWGSMVGVDIDLSEKWTVGAAFTASFGNLDATAADIASGKLDSYYVNLFARMQDKSWAHTFIVSGGWSEGKLDRTVDFGTGSYRTNGTTDGYGFGAMYELTYDYYTNESRSSVLQPLFNLSFSSNQMKGYDESGADNASLQVGDQKMNTFTTAIGGRWIGLFGGNLFGRESLGEVRVNLAQDFGDDRGKANVGFAGHPGLSQQIQGAKVGSTAVQIGAGITVPMNQHGAIFAEVNADFRSKQNSVNGSIGYRYDF